MTKLLNNADVKGYISQTAVTSSLLKTDSNGKLVAATAGTDYQAPTTALLPTGGTAGQILSKIDATNYNTQWIDNFAAQLKHEVKLGATLSKGAAVYVSSANGTNMIVSAASNASEATSSKTLGLLETGGVTNDLVKVITEGLLAGLDTSTATAGDPVWLGVNGALIFGLANKPVAPAHMVFIGIVTRVQSNNGEIFVKVQNGFELDELHNVSISSLANNQTLVWESATSLWKNKTIAAALGYTPADDSAVVKLTGDQTVAGVKTFTSVVNAPTLSLNGGVLAGNNIVSMRSNPTGGQFRIEKSDGSLSAYPFYIGADGTALAYYYNASGALKVLLHTDGTSYFGNSLSVGYTTYAATSYKLDVNGTANFVGVIYANDNIRVYGANQFWFGSAFRGQIVNYGAYAGTTDWSPFFTSETSLAFGVGGNATKALNLASNGAATFSSSVTATQLYAASSTHGYLNLTAVNTGGNEAGIFFAINGNKWEQYTAANDLAMNWYSYSAASIVMKLSQAGQLRLNTYTSATSYSGTAAGYLAFDSSGNVITVASVPATESDTLATVTSRGASTNTRTTFVELGVSKAGSDSVAAGPWFRWTNVAEDRQVLAQLNASNGLTYWTYNGSAWGAKMTLAQSGQLSLNNGLANGGGEALTVGGSGDVRLTDGGSIFWGAYDYDASTYIRAYDNNNLMRFYLNGTNSVTFTSSGITSTGTVTAPTFSGDLSGNATTASSTTYLSSLGDYVFSATTNGRSFNRGIQTSFVSANESYPSFGSVVRIRTYSGTEDGGTAELYFPYSSAYGGSSMRYRLGQYANAGWTGWKTVIDSDNIGSQSVSYASSAGAVAYGNITATTKANWMTEARNGSGSKFYLAHSDGYGMHINTYTATSTVYALELHNNAKQLLGVYADGRVLADGGNQVLHAANYSSYAVPLSGGTISGTLIVQGGGNNGSTYGLVSRDVTAARSSTSGVIYLGSDGNRYVYYNGSEYVMPGANLVLNGGALINNTDGAALLESNGAENNNWIFRENSKAWGIFYFNRGTQSGQNIGGGYATVGAETVFTGTNVGVAMPSAWTGYNSSSKIAAFIDHNTGVMFSAGSMRSRIFYDSDNLSYYLDPDSNSRLYSAQYDYIGIGQSINTSYRLITSGDIYLNANANGYAEGSWRQRRGGGTFYEVIDAGNYSGYNTYSNIYTSTLSVGGGYAEKIFDLGYFSHGVANIVAYIDFGNIQNSGYIEVEVNSTYSNQSAVGLLRKIIPFGTNLNASYWYSGDSKVQEANGSIPDNIFIGDLEWSGTNFRLPIYHVVSSGNAFTARVKYYTQAGNAAGILNAATVSTSTRSAPSNWSNNPTYNRAINTRNIQMFNNDIIGWRYSSGDSGMYNYIFNSYDNTTTGITYRSGSWTSSQNIVCHRFQTYSGNWTSWLTIYQDGGIVMPGRVDTGPIYAPTFYSSNDTSKYLDNNESSYGAWYVNGSQNGYSGFRFQGNMQLMMHTNGASGPCGLWLNNWSILTYVDSAQYLYHNGNEKFRTDSGGIYVTGTVYATGDVIAYYSDIRLKKDVEVIGGAISKIKQLRGVTYTWNDEAVNKVKERAGTRDIGLIAQEVEAVEPLLITEYQTQLNTPSNDPEEANNFVPEMSETYKTIKYEKLVALLIEGVKEQQAQIEQLKLTINDLTK